MPPVVAIEQPSAHLSGTPHAAAPSASVEKPGAARRRLLLEGPIISTLLRLAVPNVVVNVVLIAVTASIDAHFVAQLDPSALAGLSLVFPLLVAVGGWIVVHTTEAGLVGLAFVTAAGSIAYGAVVAIAFRAGAWRSASAGSR